MFSQTMPLAKRHDRLYGSAVSRSRSDPNLKVRLLTAQRGGEVARMHRGADSKTLVTEASPVVVIAGPNGAGKSTVAPALLQDVLGVTEFVNADTIAGGLTALSPERAAVAAGRVMLARLRARSRLR